MEENVKRKRPCDEDLKETFLEHSTKKKNIEGTEESDTLANKKPRFVNNNIFILIFI